MKAIPNERPTILIVDDEVYFVRLMGIILTEEGYETLSANSGTEALEIAKTKKLDLILLDIMMPGMTGFEVCEALKKKGRNPTNSYHIYLWNYRPAEYQKRT